MQWVETLDLYGPTHAEGLTPDHSVELEKKMYDAAVLSVKEGYRRLQQLSVPASRRLDYYAEMLKTDSQMVKIRARVVEAQQRIEAVETRKSKSANQKFAKQLKANKIAKKQESKKTDAKKFDGKRLENDQEDSRSPFQSKHGKGKGKGEGKGRGKGEGKGRGKGEGKGRGKGEGKGRGKGEGKGRSKGGKGKGRGGKGGKGGFKSVQKSSFKSSGKGRGKGSRK